MLESLSVNSPLLILITEAHKAPSFLSREKDQGENNEQKGCVFFSNQSPFCQCLILWEFSITLLTLTVLKRINAVWEELMQSICWYKLGLHTAYCIWVSVFVWLGRESVSWLNEYCSCKSTQLKPECFLHSHVHTRAALCSLSQI